MSVPRFSKHSNDPDAKFLGDLFESLDLFGLKIECGLNFLRFGRLVHKMKAGQLYLLQLKASNYHKFHQNSLADSNERFGSLKWLASDDIPIPFSIPFLVRKLMMKMNSGKASLLDICFPFQSPSV
jgi:hypothetical protein